VGCGCAPVRIVGPARRDSVEDVGLRLLADRHRSRCRLLTGVYAIHTVMRPAYRLIFGRPLRTSEGAHQRLDRPRALGAFGLDALSSVAYGPDEILYVVLLAGPAGLAWNVPIGIAITVLLAIIVTSYRQTIFAYPHGGGSYTVARENLGTGASLVAAAALMVDYLTTVAVSVTAGVEAIIAFAPFLDAYRVQIDVGVVLLLMFVNLRGVREAGGLFVIPTYVFVGSLGLLIGWGLFQLTLGGGLPHVQSLPSQPVEAVSAFLILRAFAGGCTAMTGVEAIANGVPAFEPPETRNAASTLVILAVMLGALFLGVVTVGNAIGAVPSAQASVIAQIGQTVAGGNPLFYVVQISAAIILSLAANTSFNGFPLLAAIMARDGFLPHQFGHRGLRLAYSNGILVLGSLAIVLIVAFRGLTHALIPLFAIGVFLCFTLSQSGMVLHWRRLGGLGWLAKLTINGLGAITTGVVTAIVITTKFLEGAWIVLVLIPLLVWAFVQIHKHDLEEANELQVDRPPPPPTAAPHSVLIPVARLDRSVAATVGYALSIGGPVRALHVVVDEEWAERLRKAWSAWGVDVPLVMLESPYREVLGPLLHEIRRLHRQAGGNVSVLLPEVVPRHLWQEALHNQTALALQLALRATPDVVVTTVPVQLER
jgi:amino acid transporter